MTSRFKHRSHEITGLKSRALNAASDMLATHGADDLNLRIIAEAAGIGIASIYHYFTSKEDLLLALAIQGYADLRADIIRRKSDPAYTTPMHAGAEAYFGFARTHSALFTLMFDAPLMARHEVLQVAENETYLVYESLVRTDERFPLQHRDSAALALWALGRGMAAMMASHPRSQPPPELLEKLQASARYLVNRGSPPQA